MRRWLSVRVLPRCPKGVGGECRERVGNRETVIPGLRMGILDTNPGEVECVRVSYDVVKAQEKILNQGLPAVLSERLSSGR